MIHSNFFSLPIEECKNIATAQGFCNCSFYLISFRGRRQIDLRPPIADLFREVVNPPPPPPHRGPT